MVDKCYLWHIISDVTNRHISSTAKTFSTFIIRYHLAAIRFASCYFATALFCHQGLHYWFGASNSVVEISDFVIMMGITHYTYSEDRFARRSFDFITVFDFLD